MEPEFLTGKEYDDYIEDFNDVMKDVIKKVITIADKHNVDRDNAMQHFSAIFSMTVQISTFENFEKGGE